MRLLSILMVWVGGLFLGAILWGEVLSSSEPKAPEFVESTSGDYCIYVYGGPNQAGAFQLADDTSRMMKFVDNRHRSVRLNTRCSNWIIDSIFIDTNLAWVRKP